MLDAFKPSTLGDVVVIMVSIPNSSVYHKTKKIVNNWFFDRIMYGLMNYLFIFIIKISELKFISSAVIIK